MFIVIGFLAVALPARGGTQKPGQTDKVAATVNSAPIYMDEFDAEDLAVQKALLGSGKPLTCGQVVSVQKEVLESLIRRQILYQESEKMGIKPDEGAVDKEIGALENRFPGKAGFKEALRRMAISEDILRSRLERNSSVGQYIGRFAANVKVTDNDLVNYYEGHLDLFKQPLQVRVGHILIKSDPGWDASRKQEARRKAGKILKELQAGKDFSALARQQSDGPERADGGDLGYVRRGQMAPQFEKVVFGLMPGQTSGIVETPYGFHLFKVIDRKPETVLAYDAVKERIRQYLVQQKARQEAKLQAEKLLGKADVKILMKQE
ncbi:MAG: peptidylprolyl isomerase [Nitrospiraceae bacterium]|nr:peptidylprolyl isomerase [Nitrospiraceae bacterium]